MLNGQIDYLLRFNIIIEIEKHDVNIEISEFFSLRFEIGGCYKHPLLFFF
jgi:hypothetical protein